MQGKGSERNEAQGTAQRIDAELKPLHWQAHVDDEMERVARMHEPAPEVTHFAEEYAERAMRGVESTSNELQNAFAKGDSRGFGKVEGFLADAGDIAGG